MLLLLLIQYIIPRPLSLFDRTLSGDLHFTGDYICRVAGVGFANRNFPISLFFAERPCAAAVELLTDRVVVHQCGRIDNNSNVTKPECQK